LPERCVLLWLWLHASTNYRKTLKPTIVTSPPPIRLFVGMAAAASSLKRREGDKKIMKLVVQAHWLLNDLGLACYRG